jgi:hypothetical protein
MTERQDTQFVGHPLPGFRYPETADGQIALYENLRAENHRAIDASTAETWLPYDSERRGSGVAAALKNCADLWVPPAGSTEHGLTQVTAIDLDAPDQPPAGQAILGAVDTVYSSTKGMYLASRGWFSPRLWDLMQVYWDDIALPAELRRIPKDTLVTINHTHLHKFDLATDPTTPLYSGSGTIPGTIEDQFSMDETADGVFRVSATEQRMLLNPSTKAASREEFQPTANHLFVMRETAEGLKTVGSVRGLAPGERIFSTRFVGKRGYVVTFRQVDPLFVFDLSVPELPRLLGELKIPGFSDYMHPLDDNHLLTIGREADETTGRDQGLSLQIFDVTDPTKPRQAHKHVYTGDGYDYSEANWNHKAFTFFAQRGLLAFPYHAWGHTSGATSSLEVFRVDAKEGFSKLGSANHSPFFTNYSRGCYFSPAVRRGVFLKDIVYSISYGGIVAADTRDMAKGPIASVNLSAPSFDGRSSCY